MFFLLFKSLAPFTINKIPEEIPVTRIQIPRTRLAAPVEPMVLYTFSDMVKTSFGIVVFYHYL